MTKVPHVTSRDLVIPADVGGQSYLLRRMCTAQHAAFLGVLPMYLPSVRVKLSH